MERDETNMETDFQFRSGEKPKDEDRIIKDDR